MHGALAHGLIRCTSAWYHLVHQCTSTLCTVHKMVAHVEEKHTPGVLGDPHIVNGYWDTGSWLERRKPEKISYYPDTLQTRANFDEVYQFYLD